MSNRVTVSTVLALAVTVVLALVAPAAFAAGPPVGVAVWKVSTTPKTGPEPVSPAVSKGVVYEGFHDGTVRAISATTGAPLWSTQLSAGDLSATPVVANGTVYVITGIEFVFALNATTGAVAWEYDPDATTPAGGYIELTNLAVGNGDVALGGYQLNRTTSTFSGLVIALDTPTGGYKWTFKTAGSGAESLTMSGGLVLASEYTTPYLFALRPTNGHFVWKITVTGSNAYVQGDSPIAVANGIGYAETTAASVFAFTVATGAVLWTASPGSPLGQVMSGPVLSNGRLYVGDDRDFDLYALSPSTGATLRTYPVPFIANGVLSVSDGQLFAASGSTLRTVSVSDGGVRWVFRSGSHSVMFVPPTVVDGVAYTSAGGTLYAVEGPHHN